MEITKPEVTTHYIRIPVANRQSGDVVRTITLSAKQGIKALYAVNRKKILTYLFDRSKGWTMEKAQAWVKAHKSYKAEKELIMDSLNSTPQRFKFTLPIIKTRVAIVKDDQGNDVEEKFVEGIASGVDVDLHGDEMAPSAIESMADSLKQHVINLNAEHDTSWQSELGELTQLNVSDNYDLEIEAKLNKMSKANDLWYALTELNKKLGLSIGGYVKEFEMVRDGEDEAGFPQWHRKFLNIELDHIAVTSSPAYPKAWVNVISKSLTEDNGLTTKTEEDNDMEEKAKWTRAFINNLPDIAFAYIEPGGKKDEGGKTVPRTNRHFPHHNGGVKSGTENDSVDKPHLRNALARCGQGAQFAAQALPHLRRHAKALGIGEATKAVFESLDKDTLVELAFQAFDLLDNEENDIKVIEILERSLPMNSLPINKDVSLEADESLKKDDAPVEPEGEGDETPATPENESPVEETPEVPTEKVETPAEPATEEKPVEEEAPAEEVPAEEPAEEAPAEEAPVEETATPEETTETKAEEQSGEEGEATEDSETAEPATPAEEGAEKPVAEEPAEKVEEKSSEQMAEVLKAVQSLTDGLKTILESNETLVARVAELESQPASRKTVEIEKGIGDEETLDKDAKTLKQEMEEKIAQVKKDNWGSPNLFALVQKVRAEYSKKILEQG